MSNAKRAIMVPVMTLAVCAIAMVGLGFALQTSVTSDSNTFEKLMIDLDSVKSDLESQTKPDSTGVNGLFDIKISTEKSSETKPDGSQDSTITQTIDNSDQYLKIFGNIPAVTLSVKVDGLSNDTGKVKSIDIYITGTHGSGESETTIEKTMTLTAAENTKTFEDLKCGIVYTVKITQINGKNVTGGSSTPLFDNDITEEVNLSFEFTAEPKNTA